MMFLAAFDGLKQMGVDPAFNVKVLLDSEEEKGSPSIPAVVTASKQLLQSDAIVIHDGPRHQSKRPTLVFGNRGVAPSPLSSTAPSSHCTAATSATTFPTPPCASRA